LLTEKKFVYKSVGEFKSNVMLPNIVLLIASNFGAIADEVTGSGGIKLFLVADTNKEFSTICPYFTIMNTKSFAAV